MAAHVRSIYTPAPTLESLQAKVAELTKQNENLAAVIRGLRANPNAVAIRVVNPAAPVPPAPRPAPVLSPLSGQVFRPVVPSKAALDASAREASRKVRKARARFEECPECEASFPVREDGTIPPHSFRGKPCEGAAPQPEQTTGPRMSGMAVLRALAPVAPVARPPIHRNAEIVAAARVCLRDGYTDPDSKRKVPGGFEPNADAIEALAMFEDSNRVHFSAKVGIMDAAMRVATKVRRYSRGRAYLPKP